MLDYRSVPLFKTTKAGCFQHFHGSLNFARSNFMRKQSAGIVVICLVSDFVIDLFFFVNGYPPEV